MYYYLKNFNYKIVLRSNLNHKDIRARNRLGWSSSKSSSNQQLTKRLNLYCGPEDN